MRAGAAAVLVVATLALASTSQAGDQSRRWFFLGRSVDGRPVRALELGDLDGPRSALVVGCIHGNECAGIAIASRLAQLQPPPETDLWIVPDLNPDGAAAGTRGNAHRVDLNRNFPWRWKRLFAGYDSGPKALSEPETRIAYRLLAHVRPTVSIWFHQHMDLVDDPGLPAARRFAATAGLDLAALPDEPGSAVTWESHCLLGAAAFVVELPAGRLSPARALRLARAADDAVTSAPARRPRLRPACRPAH